MQLGGLREEEGQGCRAEAREEQSSLVGWRISTTCAGTLGPAAFSQTVLIGGAEHCGTRGESL